MTRPGQRPSGPPYLHSVYNSSNVSNTKDPVWQNKFCADIKLMRPENPGMLIIKTYARQHDICLVQRIPQRLCNVGKFFPSCCAKVLHSVEPQRCCGYYHRCCKLRQLFSQKCLNFVCSWIVCVSYDWLQ